MTERLERSVSWQDILLAWLHDPPDKALLVRGHVSRARENARIALGDDTLSRKKIEENVTEADPMAAVVERLPMPMAGEEGEHAVGPEEGRISVVHPLSGEHTRILVPDLSEDLARKQQKQLELIVGGLSADGSQSGCNRLLAVWRLWPGYLIDNVHPCFSQLPADTRTPDHTIWSHLDITAALKAVLGDKTGGGLLALALGPVQPFIQAARSVRDLWSGSMILSWLAFRAMLPIIEQLGPTAMVYPALRGNPLLDLWLRDDQRLGGKVSLPEMVQRLTPSLPHRFLAVVPCDNDGSTARQLALHCEQAVANAWRELADAVKERLKESLDSYCAGWNKRWDDQISSYFRAYTAVLPLAGDEVDNRLTRLLTDKTRFDEAFRDAAAVRGMARAIPEDQQPFKDPQTGRVQYQDHAGRWQYQVELVNRSLAAGRSVRHVPTTPSRSSSNQRFPQKCTLLGSFEQMGPDDLAESRRFWDHVADPQNGLSIDGVRIRPGEALCAVAMVKRFAGSAFLASRLGVSPQDLRFPDTWTVAAAEWLSRAEIDPEQVRKQHGDWNGHWLDWVTERDDPDEPKCPAAVLKNIKDARDRIGRAPVYYAILKLDGDDLGEWLRGEKSPKVREVMHPHLVQYYERVGDIARKGLDARRPIGPALHAAISTALANFALYAVPEIVDDHHGTTIYSGGDDTLVLLPVSRALACARTLCKAYMSNWWCSARSGSEGKKNREYMMMGSRATLSGGLVIVHAKDDLRLALQDARRAEKQAKECGKDALVITLRRRSGEHTTALCPWEFVDTVDNWRQQFADGASDRWAYHLYSETPILEKLPVEAIVAEMRRQLARAEAPTPRMIHPDDLVKAFDSLSRASVGTNGDFMRFQSTAQALRAFLTLCHTASFMARGNE